MRSMLSALLTVAGVFTGPVSAQAPITQAPALRLVREIRIDGVAEDLVPITWVRVANSGRIAVSQSADRLVRFYDSTGRAIGRFGRGGDGPGEFRNIVHAGWFGDSLWIHDTQAARLTVIPPSLGEPVVRQTGIRGFVNGGNTSLPRLIGTSVQGVTGTGEIVVRGTPFADSVVPTLPQWARELEVAFVSATAGGGYQRFIAGAPVIANKSVSMDRGFHATPFVLDHPVAAAHDGSRVVVLQYSVEGRDAGSFSVTAVGIRGDTIFTRRYGFPLERIPAEVATKAVDERVATIGRMGMNGAQFRSRVRLPAAYAPFASIMVGRDGSVWIRGRAVSGNRTYTVLNPRGELFGRLTLAESISVEEADLNNIWTVERNADDVGSVVRYRFAR